jgi:predicted RNase H-like nuclease
MTDKQTTIFLSVKGSSAIPLLRPDSCIFEEALSKIKSFCDPNALNIVGFDQPTMVPNQTGCRPVERAVGSLISWLGGGVQPACRQRIGMFDDSAPV